MEITLSGLSVELGELQCDFNEVEQFELLVKKYTLTNSPNYWGWGKYRRTVKSSYDLALLAASNTIEKSGVDCLKIDMIIYCSAGAGKQYHLVNQQMGKMLKDLKITNTHILGQCFMGCVSVFSAISLATILLKNDNCNNILIVTSDIITKDVNRFREFGIYSDSASSFLLSNKIKKGYKVLNTSVGSDFKLMAGEIEDNDSHFQHFNKIHLELYKKLDQSPADFEKIFITNLYKPLVHINIARLRYKQAQTFYDNIQKIGHCFSSDPFINLLTYEEQVTDNQTGKYYILAAMATGHAGFCAIKKM